MGMFPFWILAAAAQQKQDQDSAAARRRRAEEQKRKAEEKLKNEEYYYSYHSQREPIKINVDEISDQQIRDFFNGFFQYVQTKTDDCISSVAATLHEKETELEELYKKIKPVQERQSEAIEILNNCKKNLKNSFYLYQNYPYLYADLPSGKLIRKLKNDRVLSQIDSIVYKAKSLYDDFDFEALHGIPLKQSSYYKKLMEYKQEAHDGLTGLESDLNSLQKQLKHTIWLPKRKELKESIQILTNKIKNENTSISFLDKRIDAYCEFYESVNGLDKDKIDVVSSAINDCSTGVKNKLNASQCALNSKISMLKRELKSVSNPDYEHLLVSYISEHPELTPSKLEEIEKGIRVAERENRDAIGKKSHVYSNSPTSIDGKIETDKMCRLIRNAKYFLSKQETERE